MRATVPAPQDFFASRSGVCVYVNGGNNPVRVCFTSIQAEGRVESAEVPEKEAAAAIAAAMSAFTEHRSVLAPLFDMIDRATETGS